VKSYELQTSIWVIYILCTWQSTQVQVHIMHMIVNMNSCLHSWCEKLKKRVVIQCITSKVLFCFVMFVSSAFSRNLNIFFLSIFPFSQLESIHVIEINNQLKGRNKLCDFFIIIKSKIIIFRVPHLHIIYNLWTWLFTTCSQMHWQFWEFVISLY